MKEKILKFVIFSALFPVFFTACATRISLQVERPPTLNTAGISRISVAPFQTAVNNTIYNELATYTTNTISAKFRALNRFTMVDYNTIRNLQRNNQSIEGHVDALFRGQIARIDQKDSSEIKRYIDKETGKEATYIEYTREVSIEFNYSLVRARDGTIIGPVTKKRSRSVTNRDRNSISSASTMLTNIVDNELRYFNRDVAPYVVTESRAMATERSKDKELKAIMKDTLAQVKAGDYRFALESYLEIYSQYKNIAAAENASILYEALGETQTAADFMRQVSAETGNPRAWEVISRLNRILQDQATIASEYNDSRSQAEKVADFASTEIQKALPANAKVWIFNNAADNTMAQAAVDNISASLLRVGIAVVDRESNAIMDAEQNFHLSGMVSDDDFVSIGNAAGANTIVVVGISGSGDMRRLQLRVLDLEKRVPLLQSDTGDNWKL